MKKIISILLFVFIAYPISSQSLRAYLDYSSASTYLLEPYIEMIFMIDGSSAKYKPVGQIYEAEIEILAEIVQEDKVVEKTHFILSNEIRDTLDELKNDFAEMVNIKIPNGKYDLYFTLKDLNSSAEPVKYVDNIEIYYPDTVVSATSAKLLQSLRAATDDDFYVRYGYSIPPLLHNYLPETVNFLPFYMEVYNTDQVLGKGNFFTVKSRIEGLSNTWLNLSKLNDEKQYETAQLTIVTHQFNITALPSGNYNIIIDVLDSEDNVLVNNTVFFQRSNPNIELNLSDYQNVEVGNSFVSKFTDINELQENVSCLYPIATPMEQDFFDRRMKVIPLDQLQRFFYNFWIKRNPNDPEGAWSDYKRKVDYVQKVYGNKTVKGYRTDRGRVYLQYGPANSVKESPFSPTVYPYEIWQYNYVEGQSNVKFVFYNPDMVSNDYILIHSDKYGEPKEPAWQREIMQGRQPVYDFDQKKPADFWGNDMDENWRNP